MRTSSNREARLKEVRAKLLAEKSRILSDRQNQLQVLTTPDNTAAEDRVTLLHEQFVAISASSRNRQKVTLIQAALERLARDEFGTCEECDEDIPLKRLQAVPWASHCVPCQEQRESTGPAPEEPLAMTA